jgi:hypothetical protein
LQGFFGGGLLVLVRHGRELSLCLVSWCQSKLRKRNRRFSPALGGPIAMTNVMQPHMSAIASQEWDAVPPWLS